jgi:hypothetical protein
LVGGAAAAEEAHVEGDGAAGARAAEGELDDGGGGAADVAGGVVDGGVGGDRLAVDGGEAIAEEYGARVVGRAVEDEVGDVDPVVRVVVEEDA